MGIKGYILGRLGGNANIMNGTKSQFISFNVAVNDSDKSTTWVSVAADYDRFKNMHQYLTKGTLVSVHGTLRYGMYTAKNGTQGVDVRMSADSIDFVSTGNKQEDENASGQQQKTTAQKQEEMSTGGLRKKSEPAVAAAAAAQEPDNLGDDLPF